MNLENIAFCVNAVTQQEVGYDSGFFNVDEISDVLHIKLPSYIIRDYSIYSMKQVTNQKDAVDIVPYAKYIPYRRWIDISSSHLDLDVGYHMYKLGFVNKQTNDVVYLYFAYRIQSNYPDRPYYYMGGLTE